MDTNGSIAMFDYQSVSGYMELYVGLYVELYIHGTWWVKRGNGGLMVC